jgi:ribonuclease HIII
VDSLDLPLIIELIPNAFVIGFEQNKKLEYLELNNIADILEQIKDPIIKYKLKTIPTKYNQLIKEFQNLNIEYIKYIK